MDASSSSGMASLLESRGGDESRLDAEESSSRWLMGTRARSDGTEESSSSGGGGLLGFGGCGDREAGLFGKIEGSCGLVSSRGLAGVVWMVGACELDGVISESLSDSASVFL
jgi:hypothetical protein